MAQEVRAMSRFVSINRLERGETRQAALIDARPHRTDRGLRWRVRGRAEEPGVDLPDDLFRELFAPADEQASALLHLLVA
jgi:hypothetical protein